MENEEATGSRTPIQTSPPDREPLKKRQLDLCSKAVRNPLAQLLASTVPPTQPAPPVSQAPQVPPAPVSLPRSMNGLKADIIHNILEEKRLFTYGVVDKYPMVWETLRFHKFQYFTLPRCPYVPFWV
uniref:Uncharacterized protein n=1 Tax=Solanum tuberosum TaxID=4113 RepID=M1DKW7_SOLTU